MQRVVDDLFAPGQSQPLRILVTGGCGNIGHNILSYIIECFERAPLCQREITLVSLDVSVLDPTRALKRVIYVQGTLISLKP